MAITTISPLSPTHSINDIHSSKSQQLKSKKSFDDLLNKEIEKARTKAIRTEKSISSKEQIRTKVQHIRNANPTIQSSYDRTLSSASMHGLNDNGMKIALKELAKKLQDEFHKIAWKERFKKSSVFQNDDENLVKKLHGPQLTGALVEGMSDELDDIGEQIFEELLTEAEQKQGIAMKR